MTAKPTSALRFLLSCLMLLGSAGLVSAGSDPKEESTFPSQLEISAEHPLFVVIHDTIIPSRHDNWTSQSFENDRYATFAKSVERAIQPLTGKEALTIVRFPSRVPAGSPILRLTVQRWELDRATGASFGTIQILASAKLTAPDGSVLNLGFLSADKTDVRVVTIRRDYRDYERVSDLLLEELVERIASLFPPLEE